MNNEPEELSIKHYFVDEAGDGVLFSRKKNKVLIGTEGCSRYFILGLIDIPDHNTLSQKLETLRNNLLADPYFKKVPSMQPKQRKTALCFHAKDDLPEVRREVFALLKQQELRFFAVVKDKFKVLEYVQSRHENDATYRYHPNELYDYTTRYLFKDKIHKNDWYNITFAKRGNSDRTTAFYQSLEVTRNNFTKKHSIVSNSHINVIPTTPQKNTCLQVVDYFLWALQRLYERREERYVEYLWASFKLVHDVDDTRNAQYGVYYTQKKPLSIAALPDDNM